MYLYFTSFTQFSHQGLLFAITSHFYWAQASEYISSEYLSSWNFYKQSIQTCIESIMSDWENQIITAAAAAERSQAIINREEQGQKSNQFFRSANLISFVWLYRVATLDKRGAPMLCRDITYHQSSRHHKNFFLIWTEILEYPCCC